MFPAFSSPKGPISIYCSYATQKFYVAVFHSLRYIYIYFKVPTGNDYKSWDRHSATQPSLLPVWHAVHYGTNGFWYRSLLCLITESRVSVLSMFASRFAFQTTARPSASGGWVHHTRKPCTGPPAAGEGWVFLRVRKIGRVTDVDRVPAGPFSGLIPVCPLGLLWERCATQDTPTVAQNES